MTPRIGFSPSAILRLCAFFAFVAQVSAQVDADLRSAVLSLDGHRFTLDSFSVMPPIRAVEDAETGAVLPPEWFSLSDNILYVDTAALKRAVPECRKILVRYRVLPLLLSAPVFRLDTAVLRRKSRKDDIDFDYAPYEPSTSAWEVGGLNTGGVYTRGISLGNNQNLTFNSNLNLQLDGKLGNDLEIRAALSDNSLPLQPDGSTRQLQEFDRIFIELKRKNGVLTAGDFDLKRPEGYFSNYFKRLQGGMFRGDWAIGSKSVDTLIVRTAAAGTRGKFARQIIAGTEGNQGPYRLNGAEGERFIIIPAGTEKVFLDGQLLQRGQADDYIMDYNLGELTFTAKRLITKDSRIIVEFEYTVQNYLRTTTAADVQWKSRKNIFYVNAYSEQDGRNGGAAGELSAYQRRVLATAGDRLQSAYVSGVDTLGTFDPTRILYQSLDTVVCGQSFTILVYGTDPLKAVYAARFTETPQGQGNYILAQTAANGRVFKWVAPDPVNCTPRGNFEPVIRPIAPESRGLFTLGARSQPFRGTELKAEAALSRRDFNRFSPLDDADNTGWAGYFSWNQQVKTGRDWKLRARAELESVQRRFLPLNPYRSPEFVRDWNTNTAKDTLDEAIAKVGMEASYKSAAEGRYTYGNFSRRGGYRGDRHSAYFRGDARGFAWTADINELNTSGVVEKTRFSRPKIDFSKTLFKKADSTRVPVLKTGFYFEREKNERKTADSLNSASFWYDLYRFYLQKPDPEYSGGRFHFGAFVSRRDDYLPGGGILRHTSAADELSVNGQWQPNSVLLPSDNKKKWTHTLAWTLNLRRLSVLQPEYTSLKAQNTYLGRADYNLAAFKNGLTLSTGYELGSGQSPKIEFTYLAVNPGEGQYTWVDRNRDSILQVDEMEIAVFQDQANYVRVGVTGTDYLRTNNLLFSQSLRFEPRLIWPGRRKKWIKMLARTAFQSSLQFNRRLLAPLPAWNIFQTAIPDTSIAALSQGLRNTLFLNRANPRWDLSLTQTDNRSQVLLTTGFERRGFGEWLLHARVNFSSRWSLESDLKSGRKTSDHENFDNRDFSLQIAEAGPKINWIASKNFRFSTEVKYAEGRNSLGQKESAQNLQAMLECTWNTPTGKTGSAGTLRASLKLADIKYTGDPNAVVAFTLLEGLQNGKNYLWNLQADRQLSKSIQLSIQYEGRKTGAGKVIHVGRAQVRAVL